MLSWQDALHRIYEVFHGGENAKATVIRPQELPPFSEVGMYVYMYIERCI